MKIRGIELSLDELQPNRIQKKHRWKTMSQLFHKQPVLVAFYIASAGFLTERTEGRVCSGPLHYSILHHEGATHLQQEAKTNVDSPLTSSFLTLLRPHPPLRKDSHSHRPLQQQPY